MDDETREALELTKDQLQAMAAEGKPARLARKAPRRVRRRQRQDLNQTAAAIVATATENEVAVVGIAFSWDGSNEIENVRIERVEPQGPISFPARPKVEVSR